jgi:hypothetical protein
MHLAKSVTSMPVSVAFGEIDPELTKRLGQIAVNWAVIEEWLGHMLGTLIDADLGGVSVLTSEMGAAAVIKAIKATPNNYRCDFDGRLGLMV